METFCNSPGKTRVEFSPQKRMNPAALSLISRRGEEGGNVPLKFYLCPQNTIDSKLE